MTQIRFENLGGSIPILNQPPQSQLAVAGVDSPRLAHITTDPVRSRLAVAGVNCKNLWERSAAAALPSSRREVGSKLAAACNPSAPIRTTFQVEQMDAAMRRRASQDSEETAYLGNRIAARGLEGMCWLLDYTYLFRTEEGKEYADALFTKGVSRQRREELKQVYAEPGPDGWTINWRDQFEDMFGSENVAMDLYYDSHGFRTHSGNAEPWHCKQSYYKAIRIGRPKGWMALDVMKDNQASFANYLQMVWDGFGDGWNGYGCIPVWHVSWDFRLGTTGIGGRWNAMERLAIANARAAARDPVLRYYASRHNLVALGSMVHCKIPRAVRGLYMAELQRCLSLAVGYEVMLWGLGQASENVVNQLSQLSQMPDSPYKRAIWVIWLDGTWWIHNARNQRIPYVMKDTGLIQSFNYSKLGADLPFTLGEMMIGNLRGLQSRWLNITAWPDPIPLPVDVRDLDQVRDIKKAMDPALQLNLFRKAV